MRRAFIALPAALALAAGCNTAGPNNQPDASGFMPRNTDPKVVMAGYVLDPEALFFSINMCDRGIPGSCPLPSSLLTGMPHLMRSVVTLGQAQVFDPALGRPTLDAGTYGSPVTGWKIGGVPRRASPPYFVYVARTIPGTPPVVPYDGGFVTPMGVPYMPAIQGVNRYLPTRSGKPITGNAAGCYGIRTPIIGDTGVVDAVVQYLNATGGTSLTAADLLNPSLYGGLAIIWVLQPSDRNTVLTAPGIPLEASAGQKFVINWSNPAQPPPPEADAGNGAGFSPRGFYVSPSPVSGAGIYAVLAAANGTTGTSIDLSAVDTSASDAGAWRPYRYRPQTITVWPGQITSVEFPAVPNYPAEISEWECYQ